MAMGQECGNVVGMVNGYVMGTGGYAKKIEYHVWHYTREKVRRIRRWLPGEEASYSVHSTHLRNII